MNWDAIGAVAELVGAIGVVASLGYLAVQIRQSTEQSRLNTSAIEASAFQQLDHHTSFNLKLIDDPGLLKTLLAGQIAHDPLEKQRFIIYLSSILRSQYNAWCLREKGLISEEQWRLFQSALRRNLGGSLGRETWALRRKEYPARFAKEVDEALEA